MNSLQNRFFNFPFQIIFWLLFHLLHLLWWSQQLLNFRKTIDIDEGWISIKWKLIYSKGIPGQLRERSFFWRRGGLSMFLVRNALIGLQPGFNNFYTRYYGQKTTGLVRTERKFSNPWKICFYLRKSSPHFQQVFKITRLFTIVPEI